LENTVLLEDFPEAIPAGWHLRFAAAADGVKPMGSLRGECITMTPFIQRLTLPLAGFFHGRVRVTGFRSLAQTENFLWGASGGGQFASLERYPRSHIGAWAPNQEESYGFLVTIHHASSGPIETTKGLFARRVAAWFARRARS
jgi:hypothetical protein